MLWSSLLLWLMWLSPSAVVTDIDFVFIAVVVIVEEVVLLKLLKWPLK